MRARLISLVLTALLVAGAAPAWADDAVPEDSGETLLEDDQGKLGSGALRIATMLARHFNLITSNTGGDAADAPDYLSPDLGFGDLFKMNLFLAAGGNGELLGDACGDDGRCEFDWGELFKDLDLPDGPRNLGQLISGEKRGQGRPDHAGPHPRDQEKPDNPGKRRGNH